MNIAGNELPDQCPDNCPHHDSLYLHGQNSICGRCPVFCCTPCIDEKGKDFYMVEPTAYRADWAKEWANWFHHGMEGAPDLPLNYK